MTDAIQFYEQGTQIADEIGFAQAQHYGRWKLACAQLYHEDLQAAREAAESARQYDVPKYNHNLYTLLGVIALRQGDHVAAQAACAEAIAHAEKILGQTPQYFDALDAKGLALAVLALCGDAARVPEAVAAYRAARTINADAGVVARTLRLLDALAVADADGLLAEVRRAAGGDAAG